jgi:hypothetical protein
VPQWVSSLASVTALVLTLALFLPYIRSIRRGTTRPHVFSWVIWGFGTCAVGLAQAVAGGGAGALVVTISGLISVWVGWLAWHAGGGRQLRPVDWLFLVLALMALPAWAVTDDPLWAVVLLTLADLLGFGPTIRNVRARPESEPAWFYAMAAVRNALVVLALAEWSLTTLLFPVLIGLACLGVATLILLGRRRAAVGPT